MGQDAAFCLFEPKAFDRDYVSELAAFFSLSSISMGKNLEPGFALTDLWSRLGVLRGFGLSLMDDDRWPPLLLCLTLTMKTSASGASMHSILSFRGRRRRLRGSSGVADASRFGIAPKPYIDTFFSSAGSAGIGAVTILASGRAWCAGSFRGHRAGNVFRNTCGVRNRIDLYLG